MVNSDNSGNYLFDCIFYITFDSAGNCAEDGKVWDYNEKRCRDDCLAWNEVNGCIYMDEEYRKLFMACADKTADCDREKLDLFDKELCKKYNAPLNLDYGYCDFRFEAKDCFKLKGNWKYPEDRKSTRLNSSHS